MPSVYVYFEYFMYLRMRKSMGGPILKISPYSKYPLFFLERNGSGVLESDRHAKQRTLSPQKPCNTFSNCPKPVSPTKSKAILEKAIFSEWGAPPRFTHSEVSVFPFVAEKKMTKALIFQLRLPSYKIVRTFECVYYSNIPANARWCCSVECCYHAILCNLKRCTSFTNNVIR